MVVFIFKWGKRRALLLQSPLFSDFIRELAAMQRLFCGPGKNQRDSMTYDLTTLLFVAACIGVGGAGVYYLFVPGAGAPKPRVRQARKPRPPAAKPAEWPEEQLAALRARVEAPEKPSEEVQALNGEPEIEWAQPEPATTRIPTLAERLAQSQEQAKARGEQAKGPSPVAPWDLKPSEPPHESLPEALKASSARPLDQAKPERPEHKEIVQPPPPLAAVKSQEQPPAAAAPTAGAVYLKGVKPREDILRPKEPALPVEQAQAIAEEAPAPSPSPQDVPPSKGHLLLVDDSKVVLMKTERLLSSAGYQVTTAVDGLDALKKMAGALPDIVITDIEMPNLDGFGLINAMQESDRLAGLPVIVMTSHIRLHLDIAATQGVAGFLPKPFDDQDLLDQVSHHLES